MRENKYGGWEPSLAISNSIGQFDYFLMEGWWYVVKVHNRRYQIYLKTKSKAESRLFYIRLNGACMQHAVATMQRRGLQNVRMSGLGRLGGMGASGAASAFGILR